MTFSHQGFKTSYLLSTAALGCLVSATNTSASYAQETANTSDELNLEEIIVTARKREQSLQKTPLAISAIGQSTLERAGIKNIADYFRTIPGLSLIDQGPSRKNIIIRGVQSELSPEESVTSVYVDEQQVTSGIGTFNPRTFDIERVEVLRGPQGTLYGGGSLAGTIRYITNKANPNQFESNVAADLSSTKNGGTNYSIDGMVNIPLVRDKLAIRTVAYYEKTPGLFTNNTLNLKNQGTATTKGFRVAVQLTPSDDFTLSAKIMHQNIDQTGGSGVVGLDITTFRQDRYVQAKLKEKATVYDLTLDYDFGWASFTSATGYLKFDIVNQRDATSPRELALDPNLRITIPDVNDNNAFTQEVRLASTPGEFGDFNWIVGAYYNKSQSIVTVGDYLGVGNSLAAGGGVIWNNAGGNPVLGSLPGTDTPVDYLFSAVSTTSSKQHSFFGEVSYNFTEKLQATVGIRHARISTIGTGAEVDAGNIDANGIIILAPEAGIGSSAGIVNVPVKENHTNYKFNLAYNVSDDTLIFAQAAQGFRLGDGGVAPTFTSRCQAAYQASLGFLPTAVKSDSLWTYELGAKHSMADGRVTLNGTIFMNKWKNVRVEADSGDDACGTTGINLPDTVTTKGLELELNARVAKGFNIGLSGSYIDNALSKAQPILRAAKGDRMPGTPKYQFAVSGDYNFPISDTLLGYARADYQYVGRSFGRFPGIGQPRNRFGRYGTANLRFGIESENWDISVYANNLLNTLKPLSRDGQGPRTVTQILRPRTIGLSFRSKF